MHSLSLNRLLYVLVFALTSLGCHQVTEYQFSDMSRITFIRTDDFQIEKTFYGIENGRILVPYGYDKLIVISSQGRLYMLDIQEISIDTSYSIGASSGIGYQDAVTASNGHIYVLGPGSQVIEVNPATGTVEDQFTPGSSPNALAASPTDPHLYFTDAGEDYIGRIWIESNHTGFTSPTSFPLADVLVSPDGQHIVAACSNDEGYVYGIWLSLSTAARLIMLRHLVPLEVGSPASCMIPLHKDSVYVIGCPVWSGPNGYLKFVKGYMIHVSTSRTDVQGHPVAMCFDEISGHDGILAVLSRTDSGGSTVTILEFPQDIMEPEIAAVMSFDGLPRCIVSIPGKGYIAVLTSE